MPAFAEISPHLAETIETLDVAALMLTLVGVPLIVAELWRLWRDDSLDKERVQAMATSLFCLIPSVIVNALCAGALIALFVSVSTLVPWQIPVNVWTVVASIVAVDFVYYWEHRCGHKINLLWALYHSVHHSGAHYDQTIGARTSFVDFFFTPLFFLPLVLAGFDPLIVLASLGVVIGYQQWIHTELVGRIEWLDGWLNTPSNHRVHHGSNPEYLDKNFGGIFIIWDRLFGTYESEVAPVEYGLTTPLERHDPWHVHTHAIRKLWDRLEHATSWRERVSLLFDNAPF